MSEMDHQSLWEYAYLTYQGQRSRSFKVKFRKTSEMHRLTLTLSWSLLPTNYWQYIYAEYRRILVDTDTVSAPDIAIQLHSYPWNQLRFISGTSVTRTSEVDINDSTMSTIASHLNFSRDRCVNYCLDFVLRQLISRPKKRLAN